MTGALISTINEITLATAQRKDGARTADASPPVLGPAVCRTVTPAFTTMSSFPTGASFVSGAVNVAAPELVVLLEKTIAMAFYNSEIVTCASLIMAVQRSAGMA
jgi:hypothetical protein